MQEPTTGPDTATADAPDNTAAASADAAPTSGLSQDEQKAEAVLTKVQPSDLNPAAGGVSEVVTGTPDRPESTRIVPPGEVPASARPADETLPAEDRVESQVAPTQVEGESNLHGNADY